MVVEERDATLTRVASFRQVRAAAASASRVGGRRGAALPATAGGKATFPGYGMRSVMPTRSVPFSSSTSRLAAKISCQRAALP